jgi:hypothetical protein
MCANHSESGENPTHMDDDIFAAVDADISADAKEITKDISADAKHITTDIRADAKQATNEMSADVHEDVNNYAIAQDLEDSTFSNGSP